jgi:hypothetical protein
VLVFKGVPAEVCANCGEPCLDDGTADQLLRCAELAYRQGAEVLVQRYAV